MEAPMVLALESRISSYAFDVCFKKKLRRYSLAPVSDLVGFEPQQAEARAAGPPDMKPQESRGEM